MASHPELRKFKVGDLVAVMHSSEARAMGRMALHYGWYDMEPAHLATYGHIWRVAEYHVGAHNDYEVIFAVPLSHTNEGGVKVPVNQEQCDPADRSVLLKCYALGKLPLKRVVEIELCR